MADPAAVAGPTKPDPWSTDLICIASQSFEEGIPSPHGPVETAPAPAATYEEKGSWLGWLGCQLAGLSFTQGSKYDWYKDACDVRGEFIRSSVRSR